MYPPGQLCRFFSFRYALRELLALTLNDLDFSKKNTINIDKNLQQKTRRLLHKTENGTRCTYAGLDHGGITAVQTRLYGLPGTDRVYLLYQKLNLGNMQRASERQVGLIRIHDLRHSHVSTFNWYGIHSHLIADRIGDTVQMVNNTYGHLYSQP